MYFSTIIPCYNSAGTLPRALDAILSQQAFVKEIILIDDGSTDDTPAVIKPYLDQYPQLFQYDRQANQGPSIARNKGATLATGEFSIFLDADDAIRQQALSTFFQAFRQHPDCDLLLSGYCSVHADKKSVHQMKPYKHTIDILKAAWFGQFSPLIGVLPMRTHVLKRVQYPTAIRHGEDVVLFSHLVSTFKLHFVNMISIDVYHHSGSLRHHLSSAMQEQDNIVSLLFNPAYLTPEAMSYQKAFHAKKMVSLARIAVQSNQKNEARRFLKRAFQLNPSIFLAFRTWKILFRTW